MFITKRDGSREEFNVDKIRCAVEKAYDATYENISDSEVDKIINLLIKKYNDKLTSVEDIQNCVEKTLMELGYHDIARNYILYRDKRENIRTSKTKLSKIFDKILKSEGDISRENANVNGDAPMGLMLLFGSEFEKDYVKRNLISEKFVRLHDDGYIHIHDLNFYACTFNCCHIDLETLFKNGFNTGDGYIRTPNSIQSAASLAAIVIQSNQNDMFGGQGIPMFEYNLAPYVAKSFAKRLKECIEIIRGVSLDNSLNEYIDNLYKSRGSVLDNLDDVKRHYDSLLNISSSENLTDRIVDKAVEMTDKDTYQAMEALIHNMNSLHSRAGAQTPFSSINYGTGTTAECRMIIKNILKATENGLGNHETPIFPIQIFKVKEGVNALEGDPNYDLYNYACTVTPKRFYPNYVNIDVPFNLQYYREGKPETEMATMGALSGSGSVVLFNLTVPSEDVNFRTRLYFNEVEDYLVKNDLAGEPIQFDKDTVYYNTNGVYIFDSDFGGLVKIKKFMIFKTTQQWYRIHCVLHNKGYTMNWSFDATEDHPLPVVGKGRTFVSDLTEGDFISASLGTEWESVEVIEKEKLDIQKTGYDFETKSDKFDTDYIVSHNCRTRVIGQLNTDEGSVRNRGNIAFTTINLPRIALETKNIEVFFERFDGIIDDCINELLERVNFLCKKKVYNFPFLMGQNLYMGSENLNWGDDIEPALRNGTLSVGFCGLAECLKSLTGKHHGESNESYQLGLSIIRYLRDKTDKATTETGWNFSTFATPAESTAGRFLRIDREKYGVIEGVTDREYYTNSFHIPVYYKLTAFEKMKKEGPFHELCNAGAITYVELDGDASKNPSVVKKLVDFSRECGISYFSINTIHDVCPICGYDGIINSDVCPSCRWKEGTEVSVDTLKRKGIIIK